MSLCSVWCCVAVGIVWVQFSVVWGGGERRGGQGGVGQREGNTLLWGGGG